MNNKVYCEYCHWEVIKGDLSRVEILFDNSPEIPVTYHTACYNYNNWLADYHKRLFNEDLNK